MSRIPEETARTLVVVVGRADFAYLEWDRVDRKWWCGVFNGRWHPDGRPKVTAYGGPRLSVVLDEVRAAPVTKLGEPPRAAQGVLLP